MKYKKISAATVTYFSDLTLLRALLFSIQDAAESAYKKLGCSVDFYIIDNSNEEGYYWELEQLCSEVFDSDFLRLHMVNVRDNLGYSGGNNIVIPQLDSDYHVVINPDVTVGEDAIWRAISFFENNKNAVMLTPRIVNDHAGCHVVKIYPDCFTLLLRYLNSAYLNDRFSSRLARYQCEHVESVVDDTVELAGGCFLFIRTNVFSALKGFDEHFFMYFEDYDLSIRAKKIGSIVFLPSMQITHLGGYVGSKSYRHHMYFSISALKFFFRHGWRLW